MQQLLLLRNKVWYSFPTQLLILHSKKNLWLLCFWIVLFGIVLQQAGTIFGIPYLFLDPEYNHQVGFTGLFILGVSLGGFIMAYHITCYILDAHRFGFLGNETSPFTKFCVNNSVLPFAFVVTYLICFVRFQLANEFVRAGEILWEAFGLLLGTALTMSLLFYYFISTNKDIFKVLAGTVNNQLRGKRRISRTNVMKKVDQVRRNRIRVEYFFTSRLKFVKADNDLMDLPAALKVLKQNHLNAFIIQCFVFVLVILLSIFRDKPGFQIPAGASILLLFTMAVLFAGAIAYWSGKWSVTVFISLLLILNLLIKYNVLQTEYEAYGLSYTGTKADYSLKTVRNLSNPHNLKTDIDSTLSILRRWRNKFPQETKPKMVFICTSGGGQRAAVWTMRSLQVADSLVNGALLKHTMLITGASGGLLGASYFRELYLQQQNNPAINRYSEQYLNNISKDNLNSIAFSLVVSDLLFKFETFTYGGHRYYKDRGYAFEQQLNKNTEGVLNKSILAYREPERLAKIPMLFMAPTVVNDGRKLYISPQHISYMNTPVLTQTNRSIKGIEFLRFYETQEAGNLRFLSALRMNATFPYITPNVALPSEPVMEVMDAGLSDNFGVSDAVRFLYIFREWINQNTSGVIFLTIRDTPKEHGIEKNTVKSLYDKIFTPIGSLYHNWNHLQDINNDNSLDFARGWFKGKISRVELKYDVFFSPQYAASTLPSDTASRRKFERASLSWHLTDREKASLSATIFKPSNQQAIAQLGYLLNQQSELLNPKLAKRTSLQKVIE
ncbi:patatin-like phospholipase family protein [Rhodocytophaga rosea]|uniref:patatin-like phospholipase family protein n=1 Tax=Rhodocytophaga rosea TaxID=2704465 RepID=UPI0018D855DF|nr:patatin-like phospholipase family protein [Rhodocytophaga rosea]